MNNGYKVETVDVVKTLVRVKITRKQMWENYVNAWKKKSWVEYRGVDTLEVVANTLLRYEDISSISETVRSLFKNNYTAMLLGDAAIEFNEFRNILREIEIVDIDEDTGEEMDTLVIFHEDIVCKQ